MSKKKIEYYALVSFSDLITKHADKERIAEFMNNHDTKEVFVTIEADIPRSKAQNRFFHGNILPAVQDTLSKLGMPKASDREWVKEYILKKPYLTVNHGEPDEYVRSTSSLSTEEFWNFCNFCLDLLVKLGGELPERGQAEYQRIVSKYHLDKAVDESVK